MSESKSKETKNRNSVGRPKGIPKTGGRRKGAPTKDKQQLLEMIEQTGCKHPIVGLAEIAKESHQSGDFDLAKDCYKELAQYVAPKRKAIEHSGEIETNNEPLVVVLSENDGD